MQRSHKIKLAPNKVQATYFAKAAGVARFTFNWSLAEWQKQYAAGEKPSAYALKKQFNAIKREQFPFVTEVTKCSPEAAFMNLDKAFKNFFRRVKQGGKPGYPKFKKKGQHDSFVITNQHYKLSGNKIFIPKLGWVRMRESLRFQGKLQSATGSKTVTGWFVSISVDIPEVGVDENQVRNAVGIDLGINKLATLSDGTVYENLRITNKFHKKIRRLNKHLARKRRGSSNWGKAREKLSRAHHQMACSRLDYIHKMTSAIASNYSVVCIEDLNTSGMVKNRRLAKSVSDAAFSEIRRQLQYKANTVVVIDRWFPSTKLCPQCGQINDMPLNKRVYSCDCGYGPICRDKNAARNILLEGIRKGFPEFKPVENGALAQAFVLE